MGCAFPGEPTGMAIRDAIDGDVVDAEDWLRLAKNALKQCDACFGLCTAKRISIDL